MGDGTTTMPFSLVDALRARVECHPLRDAFVFIGPSGPAEPISYGQLDRDAQRGAGLLHAAGVQPGEVVILAFEHGYDLVAAFWSALYAGAAPAIFPYPEAIPDAESRRQRLRTLAEFTGASVVGCQAGSVEEMAMWLAGCPARPLALNGAAPEPAAWMSPRRGGEDLAYIQFSSGATGQPKGVMLSHRGVLNNVRAQVEHLYFTEQDVFVNWLPFYHDMGLLAEVLLPLFTGALSVTMPPSYWLRRPQALFRAIHCYRGSMTWMPNFAFHHCLRTIRDDDLAGLDLASWRIVGNGSEPVQADIMHRFAERFAPWGLASTALTAGYGMAENVVVVATTRPEQPLRVELVSVTALQEEQRALPVPADQPGVKAIVSCGPIFPGVQVRIVDEADQPRPERCVGEIVVGGSSLFTGYFRRPERTAHVLRDGWFHTGDLGYLADGELYICDRKQDLIIVGGRNIFPESIEAIARETLAEQLRHVVAFGVIDATLGTETPVLVCEGRPGLAVELQAALAEQVRQRVNQALGVTLADVYFAPRGWIVRTTSGKLARSACRDKYLAAGFRPELPGLALLRSAGADPALLEQALIALVGGMLGLETVSPDASFFDLGGDSLTALRFILAVEEATGQPVPTEYFREPTVAHLVRLLVGEPMSAPVIARAAALSPPGKGRPRSWKRVVRSAPQWMRIRMRTAVEAQAFRRPYFEGVRWLLRWCGQSWVQGFLYPRESQLVRRFATSMGTPAVQVAQEVRLSLAGEIILRGYVREVGPYARAGQPKSALMAELAMALQSDPENNLSHQFFSIEGAAHVQQVLHANSGVVMVGVHSPVGFAIAHFMSYWVAPQTHLSRQGYRKRLQELGLSGDTGWEAARTSAARDALDTLAQGGLVFIAGDEQNAENGIPATIGNRLHCLTPGFAELAVRSGASILPIFATLLPDGRSHIEIAPPLTWERSHGHDQEIEAIMRAYGQVQTEAWRRLPSAVSRVIMAQHLACPQVDGPLSATATGRA